MRQAYQIDETGTPVGRYTVFEERPDEVIDRIVTRYMIDENVDYETAFAACQTNPAHREVFREYAMLVWM